LSNIGRLAKELERLLPRGRGIGEEFSSPCPFHKGGQERRPSFSVNLTNGLAFCHTCHEGWSMSTLLRELGVSHIEAQVITGLLPDVRIVSRRGLFGKVDAFRGTKLPEALLAAYRKCPTKLLDQGFEMRTLRHFEVGYDSKRGRITYPIRDYTGSLIGVFGRVPDGFIGEVGAKYKPYQQEIQDAFPGYKFGKKCTLWNFHRVYPIAWHGEADAVVVVEGFKQAMWVWQSGYKDVVALMGSYMNRLQKALLQRLGCEIVLFLDNDKAGREGTLQVGRGLRGLQRISVCGYPGGEKQPDDLMEKEVLNRIAEATDLRTWRKQNGL
jgi:DNA primase